MQGRWGAQPGLGSRRSSQVRQGLQQDSASRRAPPALWEPCNLPLLPPSADSPPPFRFIFCSDVCFLHSLLPPNIQTKDNVVLAGVQSGPAGPPPPACFRVHARVWRSPHSTVQPSVNLSFFAATAAALARGGCSVGGSWKRGLAGMVGHLSPPMRIGGAERKQVPGWSRPLEGRERVGLAGWWACMSACGWGLGVGMLLRGALF